MLERSGDTAGASAALAEAERLNAQRRRAGGIRSARGADKLRQGEVRAAIVELKDAVRWHRSWRAPTISWRSRSAGRGAGRRPRALRRGARLARGSDPGSRPSAGAATRSPRSPARAVRGGGLCRRRTRRRSASRSPTSRARPARRVTSTAASGQPLPARNHGLRRRALRLRQRRTARHLRRQRDHAGGLSQGQAPISHLYRNRGRRSRT
jgi:hypothetical protein